VQEATIIMETPPNQNRIRDIYNLQYLAVRWWNKELPAVA
jgi:hypothetical protein